MAKAVSSHYGQIARKANATPKPKKKKKRKEESRREKPQVSKRVEKGKAKKPSIPSSDASSRYRSYKKSSIAPKASTKKTSTLASAQSAYKRGQQARATQAKYKITNTSAPKTSGKITDSFKVSRSDYQKAYKKGSQTTTLGTKQKTTTTKVGKGKLKSVNALTRSEFSRMETASRYGKKMGNNLLKGGSRTGQKDIREKVGSKTAESAYKGKLATGVMQGMSKADIFSNSVGTYNKQAKKAIEKTKKSTAYNVGYGIGLAADMGIGGVGSRGASVAEAAGKGIGKLAGKGATKAAAKETGKVTKKQAAKRFVSNRAGELVAESPSNVLDAAKMSQDTNGKIDKKEMKKWLAINTGATVGVGGAIEGIGAAAAKKLGNQTIELLGKREAGNITEAESKQLKKNIAKLSQKRANNAISGDIATARMEKVEKISAAGKKAKAEAEAAEVPKGFQGGRKSRGQVEYTARAKQTAKQNEGARRVQAVKDNRAKSEFNTRYQSGIAKTMENGYEQQRVVLGDRLATLTEAEAALMNKVKSDNTLRGHAKAAAELEEVRKAIKSTKAQLDQARKGTYSGKVEQNINDLKRDNTLQGHEKAAREQEALIAEGKARADKAVADAKKSFEENPTPETKAKLELAEEAQTEAKAETPKAETSTPANPSKETKQLQKKYNKAEKEYNAAKESYDKIDYAAGKTYNEWKAAEEAGHTERANTLREKYYMLREHKEYIGNEADKLKIKRDKAKKEYDNSMSYAAIKDDGKIQSVTKQAEEEVAMVLQTPKSFDNGVISAETAGAKFKGFQSAREALIDNFASLEDIAKKLPQQARDEMLAAINELRRAKKTGRAIVAEKGRKIYSKFGLTKKGAATEAKRNDFERYCFLMHELDRKKQGNNFTNLSRDEINQQLRELEAKYTRIDPKTGEVFEDIKEFQKETVQYFRELLQREVDSGITTAEEAKKLMDMYPNYVPTYKPSDFDKMLKQRTADEINVGKGIKAAVGGEHDLVPLYNQMQVKTNVVLKRTELNRVLNLLCKASGTSEKELDGILPWFKNLDSEEKTEMLLDTQIFTKQKEGKNIATMYYNGTPVEISIDKEVFDAIRRWSGEDRKWVTLSRLLDNRVLGAANSQFKKWITDYNLIFGVKNLKRDLATALFYTKDIKGYIKNLPKGFAVSMLPDKMLTKEMKIYKEAYNVYKENGGVISQFVARDSAMDTFFDSANKFNPLKWVENFNSSMETIPRMTEFISALDSKAMQMAKVGKIGEYSTKDYQNAFRHLLSDKDAIADAMYRAKDVTLNFDRSGWLGAKLNRGLVPFFNPAIQGLDKLGRKVITDNVKYGKNYAVNSGQTISAFLKTGVALTGMMAMPALAWDHMFGDYINGKVDGYEKQSDYNRYSNYLLPVGDGKFIKIPKARELASLQASIDYAYDNMKYGSGSTWEKLFSDVSERDLFSMLKIAKEQTGPVTPFQDSLFAPIWRVRNNKTWYGGKIESGADDEAHREAGEYSKIWDENTSAVSKWIGKKFNISPKKVDNVLDSYLGVIYDMGISQTAAKNDFRVTAEHEGWGKGLAQLTRTPWGNAFIIDSVFQNANKSDYYNYVDKRNKKLADMKEGSDEYLKLKSEMTNDKTAFSYTSSQYDELAAKIWLDNSLTPAQKKMYVRELKKGDNLLWNERKDGKGVPSKDPMAVALNLKNGNGKRIMSTDDIIDSCSYTFKNGGNTIKNAWENNKKSGGSEKKFLDLTLAARDVQRVAGDSLSSPRWEVVAYANQLNHIEGTDTAMASYIEKESKRNHLAANAQIYEEYGGSLKTYKTTRRAVTQGAYDLGYDKPNDMRDGELTMVLANARTKKGAKYRDLAYQTNDFWIMNRMNAARCLDSKKNGGYSSKQIKDLCDKYKLNPKDDYSWDLDKVKNAIEKEYGDKSSEVKAAMYVVITGQRENPFGSIGDYSLKSDTGVYCEGNGYGRRGRRGWRRWHGWGHGGGGRGSSFKPEANAAGSKAKVTNTSKKKSNLDNAYRRKVKKLREETRSIKV